MIIAEVGQNWCGSMELATTLIFRAKQNGADLVKFQLYDSKFLYGKYHQEELRKDQAKALFTWGKDVGIEVFFSVFDVQRVWWCEEMGVSRYKVAFSQRWNKPLITAVEKTGKPYIVSASSFWDCFWRNYRPSILYCVPKYPAEASDMQLSKQYFNKEDGLSDHSIGLDAAKIALAKGARIIEKHFAIDHETGVDAPWSMTPDELKELKEWESRVKEIL